VRPFEQIVEEHGAVVFRVCRAVLGSDDAEDAWSETFLAALRAYPELESGVNVEAWLVRIAQRKSIDVLRAQGRRAVPVAEIPESSALDNGWDVDLWDALKALPDKQRQTVAYHHLAGFSHREVAAIVGGSEAAARRAAADGIAALRKSYVKEA
jgi:RNA polymerase sigma factor (sigma-70 family)